MPGIRRVSTFLNTHSLSVNYTWGNCESTSTWVVNGDAPVDHRVVWYWWEASLILVTRHLVISHGRVVAVRSATMIRPPLGTWPKSLRIMLLCIEPWVNSWIWYRSWVHMHYKSLLLSSDEDQSLAQTLFHAANTRAKSLLRLFWRGFSFPPGLARDIFLL